MKDFEENWITWNHIDKTKYALLLALTTASATLLSHPFYVLTTRQQAGVKMTGDIFEGNNTGFLKTMRKIGWKGLFRGWGVIALVSIPSNIIYLSGMEYSRQHCRDFLHTVLPSASESVVDVIQGLTSSVFADTSYQCVFNPGEVIAARMIVQNQQNRQRAKDVVNVVYKSQGSKGFYRGFNASLITGIMSSTIWWASYSICRRAASTVFDNEEEALSIDAVSGLIAGLSETIIVHPFDTIRARIMTGASEHDGFIATLRGVINKEGFHVLWRGIYPSLVHTIWSSTTFAIMYELVKRTSKAGILKKEEER
jgi:hypothetical protein